MRQFNTTVEYNHHKRFGGLRELAIQRDGEQCISCNMSRIEHKNKWGVDITVDRIDGYGRYSPTFNNSLENLQTLCFSCHGKKDQMRAQQWVTWSPERKLKALKNLVSWKGGENIKNG